MHMTKLALIIVALVALTAIACGSSATAPTPTATSTISRGYLAVLEAPEAGETVKTPDFTLPAATGGEFTLSSIRGQKPLAVVFYRGFF